MIAASLYSGVSAPSQCECAFISKWISPIRSSCQSLPARRPIDTVAGHHSSPVSDRLYLTDRFVKSEVMQYMYVKIIFHTQEKNLVENFVS